MAFNNIFDINKIPIVLSAPSTTQSFHFPFEAYFCAKHQIIIIKKKNSHIFSNGLYYTYILVGM